MRDTQVQCRALAMTGACCNSDGRSGEKPKRQEEAREGGREENGTGTENGNENENGTRTGGREGAGHRERAWSGQRGRGSEGRRTFISEGMVGSLRDELLGVRRQVSFFNKGVEQ